MTQGTIATPCRPAAFASLPYWRWLIDEVLAPEMGEAVRR